MISISLGISVFRTTLHMPRKFNPDPPQSVLDLIAECDLEYSKFMKKHGKSVPPNAFLDSKIRTALQLLWNPDKEVFYEDVGIEARRNNAESELIPIDTNPYMMLPDDCWIVLTPDAGC
jgi:hypothetical protein